MALFKFLLQSITHDCEGLHDPVDTVDQNRFVLKSKEYSKTIE